MAPSGPAPRFSPPPIEQARQGPQWVGIAIRFAGDAQAPNGRWLTFEYGPGAHVEVEHSRDDYGLPMDFGGPVRRFSPTVASVTVSGWPAPKSTWPDWFPGAAAVRRTSGGVAAPPDPAPVRRGPRPIGGDLVVGGERPRTGGWL